jgi:protein phosphatase
MSQRLLEEVAAAYWQEHLAFNAKLIRRSQTALSPDVRARRLAHESATTVVLAEFRNGTITMLNTGDSRGYLIDRTTGQFSRLSKDHTTFELLKDGGEIPVDAQDCDYASLATGLLEAVTAAPMADEDFAVHMGYVRLQENQVVLLCRDGVAAHLRDAEIAAEVIAALGAGENACARIVERVRTRDACDNATVIVIETEKKKKRE